jgi:hypothetical protein
MTPDIHAMFLEWRGLSDSRICSGRLGCDGSGVKTYPSTATWRGGAGGMTPTTAVCDRCWGSGDADRPWPSQRRIGV